VRRRLAEISERFRESSFANYVPIDHQQELALNVVAGEFAKSFFLHGDYARGKTHLATAQYRQLVHIERPCLMFTMAELIAELRKAEMDFNYYSIVRHRVRYEEQFHLFIDDIDKFKPTDFKSEVLFDLIDTIYKRKLGLTITSNCSLKDLAYDGIVHPSIVRRIDDICLAVEV
jgi:DNA replication protein DnaC